MVRMLMAACLMLATALVQAAMLEAHIDRTQAEMGDILTFTLTLKGVAVTDQVPSPDFSMLEKDFHILGQQRNTQLMMHNGEVSKFEQWQLQLTPKHPGTLTLPSFRMAGATSQPIPLNIRPAPAQLQKTPAFFLQNSVDTDTPYVQQQVHYQVRLYYRGELVNGAVAPPALPDAQIIRLNEQSVFRKQLNGVLYTVFEWHYALFPQRSGTLNLPAQGFTGQLYLNQKLIRVSGKTNPITLKVRPIPPTWPNGHPWLPSTKVTLQSRWDGPDTPKAGDSLTLTVTLTAEGVRGEQLPDLTLPTMKGVRIYADPSQADTRRTDQGLTGTKTYHWTLLLTQSGPFHFPNLRVPWWDTINDHLRWVSTNEKQIAVQPGEQDSFKPVIPHKASVSKTAESEPVWPWQLATVALALMSAFLLWRLRQKAQPALFSNPSDNQKKTTKPSDSLCNQPLKTFYLTLLHHPSKYHPDMAPLIEELEKALFLEEDLEQGKKIQQQLCQKLNARPSKKVDNRNAEKLKSIYP